MTLDRKNQFYHTTGLSGAIPLSFTLGIPLIMTEKLKVKYEFTSPLTYKQHVKELIRTLVTMSSGAYTQLQAKCRADRSYILKRNIASLKIVLKPIT
jgi:hypothetical protein